MGNLLVYRNAATFTAPAPFTYGNEPQYITQVREAATKNVDFAVAKSVGTERFRAQIRGEFLNAFNHPIYGGEFFGGSSIANRLDCGRFSQVFGTRYDPRNIQLSLKLLF